mmetsp:Transcript_3274/g.5514  ORF Transcript_3274/g.5514 Transcript_3274/m.5514 type:complete len:444 (-) Transcript_3274:1168-2499(-)|eukprot:CAMPEP_0184524518 /NCGR_PEP_ID=MMETSP0198_2-20121128/9567_1 /TAXON_ID=1112570 /ORGANISM="Thraustochytrium sp., Strain LLF1b" /LENGTH=443 /DNA_ID=CAMNT_0026915835 /DNA_START=78 /DNA_END=1409 /DNA_ORIENTATION=+
MEYHDDEKYAKHDKQGSKRNLKILIGTMMCSALMYSMLPYHNSKTIVNSRDAAKFQAELEALSLQGKSNDDPNNLVADDNELEENGEDNEGLQKSYPKYEVEEKTTMVFANDVEGENVRASGDKADEEEDEHTYDEVSDSDIFEDQAEFENAPIIKVLSESKVRKYSPIVLAHERYYRANPSKLYVPRIKKTAKITKEQFKRLFMDKSQPVVIPFEAMRDLGFNTKPGWTLEELKELYPNSKPALYKYGAVLSDDIDIGPAVTSLMSNKKLRKTSTGKSYPRNTKFKLDALRQLNLEKPAVIPDGLPMMLPSLWFASTSEATPLHSDCCDNWAMMVSGTKKWYLAPPSEARVLKPNCAGGLCWVKKLPHADEHAKSGPETRLRDNAQIFAVDTPPGHVLYVPAGWFHHVEQPGPTVMINFWSKNGPEFLNYYNSLVASESVTV